MYFRIEKDTTIYDCMCYDTKVTSPAMKLVKDSVIKYVAMGTVRNGPNMKFNDYYILLSGKQETPTTPYISASGYGSVTISSSTAGAYITYKGETKPSGSTWTHDSFYEYSGYAYAYVPSDGAKLQSDVSAGLWIGMLGKPHNAGYNAHWDNYSILNYNMRAVTYHVTGATSGKYKCPYLHSYSDITEWSFTWEGWWFNASSGTLYAATSSTSPGGLVSGGDFWEADRYLSGNTIGGSDDDARLAMWAGETYYHATLSGWITSVKERVKNDEGEALY